MMEYCIASTRGLDAQRRIVRKICDLIQGGWTPQGGIFCIVNGGVVLGYQQAMVRMKPPTQQVNIRRWDSVTVPLFDKVDR